MIIAGVKLTEFYVLRLEKADIHISSVNSASVIASGRQIIFDSERTTLRF